MISAAACRSVSSLTSNGTKRCSVPAPAIASSSRRVLSDVPEPELDEHVGSGGRTISAACVAQDRALGAGRVVLGQSGDLVEQLAAVLVVEPHRRQRLRRRGRAPTPRRRPSRRAGGRAEDGRRRSTRVLGHETGSSRAYASRASRAPLKAQRAAGGKKLRYVARTWPVGVAQQPPRSTCWLTMNLPLYSPTAPAAGRKRGIRAGTRTRSTATRRRTTTPDRCRARVQLVEVEEATRHGRARGRVLPLGFGRQAGARPVGERVGLVVADVAHRLARVDRLHAREREHLPAVVGRAPSTAAPPSPVAARWPSRRRARARRGGSRRRP